MRRSLAYALLLSIPAGITLGSGIVMMSGEGTLGIVVGIGFGVFVFAIVLLGREYGSADERLADGP